MNESDDNGKPDWRDTLTDVLPVAIVALALLWIVVLVFLTFPSDSTTRDILLAVGAGVGAPIGLWLSYRRTVALDQQNRNTEKSLTQQAQSEWNTRTATAFTEATNQLGANRRHIRAAGCHALGQIALEDWQRAGNEKKYESVYYNTCIDILSGFLRSRCSAESCLKQKDDNGKRAGDHVWKESGYRLPADIEAAITTLSKCNSATNASYSIDLRGADLRCWKGLVSELNLRGCLLESANLSGAYLPNINLEKAEARNTDFSHANFFLAEVSGFRASACNFNGTTFILRNALNVEFSRCAFDELSSWIMGDLNGTVFDSCLFRKTSLKYTKLDSTSFRRCTFSGGELLTDMTTVIDRCCIDSLAIGGSEEFWKNSRTTFRKNFSLNLNPPALSNTSDVTAPVIEPESYYIAHDYADYSKKFDPYTGCPGHDFNPLS